MRQNCLNHVEGPAQYTQTERVKQSICLSASELICDHLQVSASHEL